MRLDPAQTKETVDQIMGHFMGNRVAEAVFVVFGKQPGIVADAPIATLHLVHARALTFKVEINCNTGKFSPVQAGGFFNTTLSGSLDLAHLEFGYRLNHRAQYIVGLACYNTQKIEHPTKMNIDFHCHTTASDGSLDPTALIDLALEREIDMLSVTDHDTMDAYQTFGPAARQLQLIPGIELSSQWSRRGVHIVGLNIDSHSDAIGEAIEQQSKARQGRAEIIAQRLARLGFADSLEGAQSFSNGPQVGRPHFAQHLVAIGAVTNIQQAFKRYLGAGKVGDVKDQWPEIDRVINWIRDAGGVAVLAHPTKYKLTRTRLVELIAAFKAAGGEAMEVISGAQVPSVTRDMARLCRDSQLEASAGSDVHSPNQPWASLGHVAPLPDDCTAVWRRWQ